jgi:Flp pilus assembly protein TadG
MNKPALGLGKENGMNTNDSKRSGMAATELALMLPFIFLLLFMLVEGANAMHMYSSLQEASREGARLVLMEGESADVTSLVRALVSDVPPESLTTTVNTVESEVTVIVSCQYTPFNGGEDGYEFLTGSNDPFVLKAQTTMPRQ